MEQFPCMAREGVWRGSGRGIPRHGRCCIPDGFVALDGGAPAFFKDGGVGWVVVVFLPSVAPLMWMTSLSWATPKFLYPARSSAGTFTSHSR